MARQVRIIVVVLISCCFTIISSNKDANKTEASQTEDETPLHKRNAQISYPDQITEETEDHHGDHSRGAKYFMYAHQPDKKQYEFGYKRGNGKHSVERYEKAGPNHNFKTKVRWQDGKNGHGEHYWDYNHVPKYDHHDDGHGKGGHGHGGGGHHSEPVPEYIEAESQKATMTSMVDDSEPDNSVKSTEILKRFGLEEKANLLKNKLASNSKNVVTGAPSAFPKILGYDPYVPPAIALNRSKPPNKIVSQPGTPGGENGIKNQKSVKSSANEDSNTPKLAYDIDTGRIYEEKTNTWFKLVPIKI